MIIIFLFVALCINFPVTILFQYLESINSMKSRADFDPGFFQFLIPLCLAQAQECIAEKSITDNRKPSISGKFFI